MLVKGHFECYLCDITQPQIMKNTDECVRVIEETVFDIKMEVND